MNSEVFYDLPKDFNLSNYEISKEGSIRVKKTLHVMSKNPNKLSGYIYVELTLDNETRQNFRAHILVCKTFKENPNKLPTVDHINRIKTDNRLENLRFASFSDQSLNRDPQTTRQVNQLTLNGEFMKTWESAKIAAKSLGIYQSSIRMVLCGKRKTAGKFKWEYTVALGDRESDIWKKCPLEIKDNIVTVSSSGKVKVNGKHRRGGIQNGYRVVGIDKIRFYVHRLVCMTFKENLENGKFVSHLDGDLLNNNIENLAWK